MDDIVNCVSNSLTPFIIDGNLPYCFYGHSLGALIAFEVSRELQRRKLPLPRHLYLSGRGGPNAPEPFENRLSVDVLIFINLLFIYLVSG
jgi:surfactin synthase thioesterase subunit